MENNLKLYWFYLNNVIAWFRPLFLQICWKLANIVTSINRPNNYEHTHRYVNMRAGTSCVRHFLVSPFQLCFELLAAFRLCSMFSKCCPCFVRLVNLFKMLRMCSPVGENVSSFICMRFGTFVFLYLHCFWKWRVFLLVEVFWDVVERLHLLATVGILRRVREKGLNKGTLKRHERK